MTISELTAYAAEKYGIEELYKWSDFPGFSVLCHPETGKWVALLMRQWNGETGEETERCDLKCGRDVPSRPYISAPLRMSGDRWAGISFDDRTESDVVFRLFDKAIKEGSPSGYKIILASQLPARENVYKDTPLPFANSDYRPPKENNTEKIREMKRLYEYGPESDASRARNFYRQAVFMRDYEDDYPWQGDFICYFPTYHDLTTNQLRGYFTWRARIRKGVFAPITASAAYIYVYELLNGVGANSPKDTLELLKAFDDGYVSRFGNKRMTQNLRRWMFEYAVVNGVPIGQIPFLTDSDVTSRDNALAALKNPQSHTCEEVFDALCFFGGKTAAESPVIKAGPERGKRLFSESWRTALAYRRDGKNLFELCFGKKTTRRWHPLANAVYYEKSMPKDGEYAVNECRVYRCKKGIRTVTSYEKTRFNREIFCGFLRETDAILRRCLKTGRYLQENPDCEWAIPFVTAVAEAERKAELEAAKPKITIDLSGLDRIRVEAAGTRDSLLTEEDTEEYDEYEEKEPAPTSGVPLDSALKNILRALLEKKDAAVTVKEARLMPSIAADLINEALYDEIGDTVILCENDRLTLVDDYTEDLERMLGGNSDG